MRWIVLKFGGTSVSSGKTWETILARTRDILADEPSDTGVWIVVSALSQVTNRLVRLLTNDLERGLKKDFSKWFHSRHDALMSDLNVTEDAHIKQLVEELERLVDGIELTGDSASSRLQARVLSFGERMSSRIGHAYLSRELQEYGCSWVDARNVLVATSRRGEQQEDKFLNAEVLPSHDVERAEAQRTNPQDRVVITQGYVASTPKDHQTCVLGRGGSDTSGGLFSAVLKAERFEIWTDVHGMFTSDPRTVKAARHIKELSYREAQELAAMGAKVLNPRCLAPPAWAKIPVEIHNTMDPKNRKKCTRIVSPEMLEDYETTVMAIARRLGQVMVTISSVDMQGASGFLSKAFAPFESLGISVDLIATSQYAVSMTLDHIPGGVDGSVFEALLEQLEEIARVQVHKRCAVVSIVGRRLRTVLHLMADAFKELAQYDILLLSESSEDLNLSFVIDQSKKHKTDEEIDALVESLHYVLLERENGLKSQSPCLFGSTLPEMLRSEVVTSPESGRAIRSTSGMIAPFLDLEKEALEMSQQNLVASVSLPSQIKTPMAMICLSELKALAPSVVSYPVTFSMNPAVLRAVYSVNRDVVFHLYTEEQLRRMIELLGTGIRVLKDARLTSALRLAKSDCFSPDYTSVTFVETDAVEGAEGESLARVADGTSCKVIIVSVIHVDELKGEVVIDAYWDPEANVNAEICVAEEPADGTESARYSVKAAVPSRPLNPPVALLSDAVLPSSLKPGQLLLVRNVNTGVVSGSAGAITERIKYTDSK